MLHRNVKGIQFTVNQYADYFEDEGKRPSGQLESANFCHFVGASLPFWVVETTVRGCPNTQNPKPYLTFFGNYLTFF
jgi:hypothetical protein